jgi:PAS domain S-box-containing protein
MSRYVERVIDMLPKLSAEEVKRVLLEVVNENSMLDSFIESFSTGLILVDKKWHILQINKAAKRILRISFDDEKNEDELLFNVIEENEEISDWLKNIADSQKTNVREEFSTSCSDGSVRFLAVSVFSFIQKTEISGSIVKIEDITQLKAKAVLDRRLENMEGLTNLAAGMAHEIKNPLGAISIHIQLVQKAISKKT